MPDAIQVISDIVAVALAVVGSCLSADRLELFEQREVAALEARLRRGQTGGLAEVE